MSKFDIVFMFIVAQGLALWGLWDIPSNDVNVLALLLSFITLELLAVAGWLFVAFIISPLVVLIVEWVRGR